MTLKFDKESKTHPYTDMFACKLTVTLIARVLWAMLKFSITSEFDYLTHCTDKIPHSVLVYRIFPAIRRGFRPSRMTSNNLISPMKFCYNTNSTLPKQSQSSRSILQDGSRTFGLFWKEKKRLITEEIR